MRIRWSRWVGVGLIFIGLIAIGQANLDYGSALVAMIQHPTPRVGIEDESAEVPAAEASRATSTVGEPSASTRPMPTTQAGIPASDSPIGPGESNVSVSPVPGQLFGLLSDAPVEADAVEPEPTTPTTIATVDNPTPGVGSEEGELVVKVIDGDTIELEGGERVRYIGIDTPESTIETECYGEEAKQRNRELVDGKRVRLELDVEALDKYGRTLAYVYLPDSSAGGSDTFVNELLVAEGFASTLTIPPNVRFTDHFAKLAATAREQGRGLWKACGGNGSNSRGARRSDYDETIPQATTTDCPSDRAIKGNAQSMIYHVPGGDFYGKTKPEACFATEGDAETAGYRKSKR